MKKLLLSNKLTDHLFLIAIISAITFGLGGAIEVVSIVVGLTAAALSLTSYFYKHYQNNALSKNQTEVVITESKLIADEFSSLFASSIALQQELLNSQFEFIRKIVAKEDLIDLTQSLMQLQEAKEAEIKIDLIPLEREDDFSALLISFNQLPSKIKRKTSPKLKRNYSCELAFDAA